jgi:hypothetical protein
VFLAFSACPILLGFKAFAALFRDVKKFLKDQGQALRLICGKRRTAR